MFGIVKISPNNDLLLDTVILDKKFGDEFIFESDIVPPSEGSVKREVTPEQILHNKIRLAERIQ